MKTKTEKKRGFIQTSRAWYGAASLAACKHIEEIFICFYDAAGNKIGGEILVAWHGLGSGIVPRLECFDGAWENLTFCSALIEAMGKVDGKGVTPQEFRDILLSCGFEDMTPTSAGCEVAS